MAIYKADKFHIDIEEQDYPDADCKFMISLWHEPKVGGSRELIAVCLSDNVPYFNQPGTKAMLLRVLLDLMILQFLMAKMSISLQDLKAILMRLILSLLELMKK